MGPGADKGYRRSWKNLLLDKHYQLRFTLFMVGVSAGLMVLLGAWVMDVADKATAVAIAKLEGESCPTPSEIMARRAAAPAAATAKKLAEPGNGKQTPASGAMGNGTPPTAPQGVESTNRPRRKVDVTLDEMEIKEIAAPNPPIRRTENEQLHADALLAYSTCVLHQNTRTHELKQGYYTIMYVLIAVGLMLVLGLTFYGIKMTHRVAGPLHKISLHFAKMRDGKYDTVLDLRKGDQLTEFYSLFKAAHDGLRTMQRHDIERIQAVLAAAERDGVGERSAEARRAMDELRAAEKAKEESLG